jgi:aerobic carbon-monoxide dehydrogenase medium subunit
MYSFDYVRAASVEDAVAAFREADDARYLAGGMTLIPTLSQRLAAPTRLIDVSRIDRLDGIRLTGAALVIGAAVSHDEVSRSAEVRKNIPALAAMAAQIGDPQVRNRGTLGGSVANNDPAADYPAAVLGLGATIVTDRRRIAADAFFLGLFETALESDELVVAVSFPVPDRAGYAKFRQPASRYALVGVLVARTTGGVRVVVTGASPCVFRHVAMEEALEEKFAPESLDRIETPADGLNVDLHGSAAYRAHLVGVLAKRAVAAAG